jgi:hypothetical protein
MHRQRQPAANRRDVDVLHLWQVFHVLAQIAE